MGQIFSFFIILCAALFFSQLFKRLHLPWVITLIVTGIIIGPQGFDILEVNGTIQFFSEVGIILLMFMVGTETKLDSIKKYKDSVLHLTVFNSIIPFISGFALGLLLQYDIIPSFLLGVVFMSSAVAVAVPSLERNQIIETKLGKTIVSATMIQDVIGLICLSVVLRGNGLGLPLPLTFVFLIGLLFLLKWASPRVEQFLSKDVKKEDMFEQEPRVIFTILIGTVICFELLGLHPIIAGFFSGLVLSDTIKGKILRAKLHALSYGLFIPLFFVMVGVQTQVWSLFQTGTVFWTTAAIIITAIITKFVSGFIAAKMEDFSPLESTITGFSTLPRLSTSLAIAITSFNAGLFDQTMLTSMIALTIVSTFIGSFALDILGARWMGYQQIQHQKKKDARRT